jgi:aspartate aminotransferase-like enzyme
MKKKLLMTPGPTPVPESVLLAMARPVIHHRHPEFKGVLEDVRELLKYLFVTKQEVILLAASGTGAMEGAVSNTLSRGDKVLVVEAGKFGERWGEISRAYGLEVDTISVPWGKAVEPGEVISSLEKGRHRAVLIQASETSTGVRHPVREIADHTRKTDTLLIVDGITAVGVFPIPFDEWGIDVLVTGSQKALMLPPGLAFACLSERAWKANQNSDLPRYYLDFAKEKKNLEKGQTSYTPAISLIVGLRDALRLIKEMGLEQVFSECDLKAEATREAVKALGLKLYAPDAPSQAVTAVLSPPGIEAEKIVKIMRDKHGIAVAGGQDQAKGKIFRIAHMGYISRGDTIATIAALEQALAELGHSFKSGSGVQKVTELLA